MLKIGNVSVASGVVLGPMAGVTDLPFREICKEFGCGMTYSEMVSSKAMHFNDKKSLSLLNKGKSEVPFVVQIFGSDPYTMAECASKIEKMQIADIIDINMGCPVPKVVNNGDGSALMKNLPLAYEIIKSVVDAVNLPVTVKFRKGWDHNSVNAVEFALNAEKAGVSAIAVHGRTRSDFYTGNADWDIIKEVKNAVSVPVIGNGDVFQYSDIERMKEYTNGDGVMIARGALGNPFIFSGQSHTEKDVIKTALNHLDKLVEFKGEYVAVREARKHMSWYIKGMHNAAKYKNQICMSDSSEKIRCILNNIIS